MRHRDLLHQIADAIADRLETEAPSREYYDQDSSPLPAATHTRLVRRGVLPGYKVNGRVLVKRADMHRYIEKHRVEPVLPAEGPGSEDAAVAALLDSVGIRKGRTRAA